MELNENIIEEKLIEFRNLNEKFKNCYFWNSSDKKASVRRAEENEANFPEFNFELGGREYTISASLDVSCHHYYFTKVITRDGRETNMRVINTLLKNK